MSGHAEAPQSQVVDNTVEYSTPMLGVIFLIFILPFMAFSDVRSYTSEKQTESPGGGGH